MEKEFENNVTYLSGAQMGSNHDKNRCQKSRDTLPLLLREKKNSKNPKRLTIQLKNFTKNKKKANDAMYCREREGDKTI